MDIVLLTLFAVNFCNFNLYNVGNLSHKYSVLICSLVELFVLNIETDIIAFDILKQ